MPEKAEQQSACARETGQKRHPDNVRFFFCFHLENGSSLAQNQKRRNYHTRGNIKQSKREKECVGRKAIVKERR